MDLDNPKTFNQKIQWLKLNYLNPAMPRCVDKAEFKNYIDEQLGKGYTVPNYGAYENENDIDLMHCLIDLYWSQMFRVMQGIF